MKFSLKDLFLGLFVVSLLSAVWRIQKDYDEAIIKLRLSENKVESLRLDIWDATITYKQMHEQFARCNDFEKRLGVVESTGICGPYTDDRSFAGIRFRVSDLELQMSKVSAAAGVCE